MSSSTSINTKKNLGGAERDRTADPLLAKQVLSQLSYSPIRFCTTGRYNQQQISAINQIDLVRNPPIQRVSASLIVQRPHGAQHRR